MNGTEGGASAKDLHWSQLIPLHICGCYVCVYIYIMCMNQLMVFLYLIAKIELCFDEFRLILLPN